MYGVMFVVQRPGQFMIEVVHLGRRYVEPEHSVVAANCARPGESDCWLQEQ